MYGTVHDWVVIIAGVCALFSTLFSLFLVYKHLRNYTNPRVQRCIIRILFMVPIYAIMSWLSLLWIPWANYFDLIRDCYEAYLIYQFFMLLLEFINTYKEEEEIIQETGTEGKEMEKASKVEKDQTENGDENDEEEPLFYYVGGHKVLRGEERVVRVLKSKHKMNLGEGCHPIPTPCCPKFGAGRTFLRWTKRMILQFVIVNPLMAVTTLVLEHLGLYSSGDLSPSGGYLYICIIDNISICTSMYFLVLFYHSVSEELKPFRPIPKFLCIKAIIAFAFWQSIAVAVLAKFGLIQAEGIFSLDEVSVGVQDFLIVIELVPLAIVHAYVFGHATYRNPNKLSLLKDPGKGLDMMLHNIADMANPAEIFGDALKTFRPTTSKYEKI